ncbi:orotidine-5'-phosphate decarboxylase [bacterium]|nr:orotidine-5'-phosphate decarboxylase [bacterium]
MKTPSGENFWEKLRKCSDENSSSLVVGLDPNLDLMPKMYKSPEKIFSFLREIIDATGDLVCAYKPNLAFYISYGIEGLKILEELRKIIPEKIPIILDGKFGDVGHTGEQYAKFSLEVVGADAITLNPYMGKDVLKPFVKRNLGIFLLCATSNPGYSDIEAIAIGDTVLFEKISKISVEWSEYFGIKLGLVVGATHPDVFSKIRHYAPNAPFLVPGIGAQGGKLESAVKSGRTKGGIMPLIVSARGILYASSGKDFANAARKAAGKLRDDINTIMENYDE